jgi:hypothetical protein
MATMRARHLLALLPFVVLTVAVAAQSNPYLGKWNLTGTGDAAGNVYWLKVEEEGGQLTGLFLNRTGSPGRLAVVKVENGELVFQGRGREGAPGGPEYRARLENGRLVGYHLQPQGGRRGADPSQPPPAPRRIEWVGTRPPAWPAANANGRHTYGAPVVLFDGKSLDAFDVQFPNRALGWTVADGVAQNEKGANNLVSKQKFTDFRVELEYKLGAESNSGLYLRGRYELQIFDDAGQEVRTTGHAAIYGHTPPKVNASKPIGEWQTLDAVIVANRVTVTLNSQRVHDNQVIEGITGGALDNNELAPGPLMIQGDHMGVWIRKIVVTPITAPGR